MAHTQKHSSDGDWSLFRLPVELRIEVYEDLLHPKHNRIQPMPAIRRWDGSHGHCCGREVIRNASLQPTTTCTPAMLYPAILRTCLQIHAEASPVLYSNTEFRLEAYRTGTTTFERLPQTYLPQMCRLVLVLIGSRGGWNRGLAALASLWPQLQSQCPGVQELRVHLEVKDLWAVESFNSTAFDGVQGLSALRSVEVMVHGRSLFFGEWDPPRVVWQKETWRTLTRFMASEVKEYVRGRLCEAGRGDVVVNVVEGSKGCVHDCRDEKLPQGFVR